MGRGESGMENKWQKARKHAPKERERDPNERRDRATMGGDFRAGKDGGHHCNHCHKKADSRCFAKEHIGWCPNGHGTCTAKHGCIVCRCKKGDLIFSMDAPKGYNKAGQNMHDGQPIDVLAQQEEVEADEIGDAAVDVDISTDNVVEAEKGKVIDSAVNALEISDEQPAEAKVAVGPTSLFEELRNKQVEEANKDSSKVSKAWKARNTKVQDYIKEGLEAKACNVEGRYVGGQGRAHIHKRKEKKEKKDAQAEKGKHNNGRSKAF